MSFKGLIWWMVHTEVFIDPNFSLTCFVESDHSVSDRTWDNNSAGIWKASQGVIQYDGRVLFIESGNWIEENWNGLSEYVGIFLASTESETWAAEVGSDDLDPIGSRSSLAINFNFIIDLSIRLDIEVVKIGFFTFAVCHDFVVDWSVGFLPVFGIVVEAVGFWVVAAHCFIWWDLYFKKIRFYWFYLFFFINLSTNVCLIY